MKIAVAAKGNPDSIETWSGIPYYIIKALQRSGHTIVPINLQPPQQPWFYDWYRRLYYRIQKRWFLADVEPFMLQHMGQQFDKAVNENTPDLVISIHGDFLAYTSFSQPAIIVHDATFAKLLNYYSSFSRLTKRSVKAGNMMYKLAVKRANAGVYSSQWASNSAIADYGMTQSKVFTIPFGANLDHIPLQADIERWISGRAQSESCEFLFLGSDWERKGGPSALLVIQELNKRGFKSRLSIVGCNPTVNTEQEKFINRIGFLRKNITGEALLLKDLFIQSNALLLPSQAECYGCVYCEANAYGLPALGRDTGGVSQIIKNDINGLLWKADETVESYAERWIAIWKSPEDYKRMSLRASEEYRIRLNYDVFVSRLEDVMKTIS